MSFGENIDELVENSINGLHSKHNTWTRVRVGDVATLVNGFAFKSSGFNDKEGTPIVRIRDVTKGEPGTFYRGSVDDPKMTFIENGQIAIGMDGDFNCRIWKGGRALLNQRVCALDANEEFYSQEFLAYVLPGYLKLINDHTSSITVKHLSSITVQDIPLPLPPLNEQRRIVEKIETLFARLDQGEAALRHTQTLLARYRQSVLKAAVTGALTADWRAANAHRLEHGRNLLARILQTRRQTWQGRGKYQEPAAPDTSDLPELPAGWVWATVEQLSSAVTKGSSPNWQGFEYADSGILFIRSQNVGWGELRLEDRTYLPESFNAKEGKSVMRKGDILLNIVGASIGRCAIASFELDGANCNQAVAIIRMVQKELAPFLLTYLLSPATQERINSEKVDVARANYSLAQIRALPIPLPPGEEQQEIARRVGVANDQIDTVESGCQTELTRSAALRQSILKDAFAGKLVPQDPSDEPAAELLDRIRASRTTSKNNRRKNSA